MKCFWKYFGEVIILFFKTALCCKSFFITIYDSVGVHLNGCVYLFTSVIESLIFIFLFFEYSCS